MLFFAGEGSEKDLFTGSCEFEKQGRGLLKAIRLENRKENVILYLF